MRAAMSAFVGRENELRALQDAREQASGSRLVLISGEPGIGKTRLVEELTQHAEGAGGVAVWGRAWEGEGTPAYFPWIQVLRRLAAVPAARTCVEDARAQSAELDTLFGAQRARGPHAVDPAEAKFRLFDAVARLLERIAEAQPLTLVLDDVHSADVA